MYTGCCDSIYSNTTWTLQWSVISWCFNSLRPKDNSKKNDKNIPIFIFSNEYVLIYILCFDITHFHPVVYSLNNRAQFNIFHEMA